MAGTWNTASNCLQDIKKIADEARDAAGYYTSVEGLFKASIVGVIDPAAKQALEYVADIFDAIHPFIFWSGAYYAAYNPHFCVPYYLKHFTTEPNGDEFELTWQKIVAAWIDADIVGRVWTVATLDELRKEAWDQPFEGFGIKAGALPE